MKQYTGKLLYQLFSDMGAVVVLMAAALGALASGPDSNLTWLLAGYLALAAPAGAVTIRNMGHPPHPEWPEPGVFLGLAWGVGFAVFFTAKSAFTFLMLL